MPEPAGAPLVAMTGVSKSYLGVRAVDDVDLAVGPGECVGLVGKNGAGKSTLIKVLAGIVRPDAGSIAIDGRPVTITSPDDAQRHGLAFVHQELNDVPTLTVADNVWLGYPLPKRALRVVDRAAVEARAEEMLALVGATARPQDRMGELSIAQRQLVMLSRAVSRQARLIVMDEPTASLSDREVDHLRGVLARLRERGTSVVFVSHRLGEVLEFCDRVVVMRDGRVVARRETAGLEEDELVRLIIGERPAADGERAPAGRGERGEVVLEVEGLSRGTHVRDVDLVLHAGEVLGIAGLVGSGRTELARLLAGIDRPTSGAVRVRGRRRLLRTPADAMAAGITLLPEDRLAYGLVRSFQVRENLTLPTLRRFRLRRWLPIPSRAQEVRRSREIVERLSIATSGVDQIVSRLSGGNQQKVVLGKWLLSDADVFIFDEPTDGVDVGAKAEIFREVRALAAQGKAIIFISSEFEELLEVSDRVLVLREGRVSGELEGDDITEARMVELCYAAAAEGGS